MTSLERSLDRMRTVAFTLSFAASILVGVSARNACSEESTDRASNSAKAENGTRESLDPSRAKVALDIRRVAVVEREPFFERAAEELAVVRCSIPGFTKNASDEAPDLIALTSTNSDWIVKEISGIGVVSVDRLHATVQPGRAASFGLDGASLQILPVAGAAGFTICMEIHSRTSRNEFDGRRKKTVWDGQTLMLEHPAMKNTLLFVTVRLVDFEGKPFNAESAPAHMPRMQPRSSTGKPGDLVWEVSPQFKSEQGGADQAAPAAGGKPKDKKKPKKEEEPRSR